MGQSLGNKILRLLQAINFQYDAKLLYSSSQFYSKSLQRTITMYTIKQAVVDEESDYTESVELFRTTYRFHILLFLRDYLYECSGKEVPTDDEKWENAKKRYAEKRLRANAKKRNTSEE